MYPRQLNFIENPIMPNQPANFTIYNYHTNLANLVCMVFCLVKFAFVRNSYHPIRSRLIAKPQVRSTSGLQLI